MTNVFCSTQAPGVQALVIFRHLIGDYGVTLPDE